MATSFDLNGKSVTFEGDGAMPLLWYLRDHAGLTGTKFGCGLAQCGACTVHIDGGAVRSCVVPVSTLAGKRVRTIESLADGDTLHAVQQAWIEEDVAQCGYCQAGQIMAAVALLARVAQPRRRDRPGRQSRCGYVWANQSAVAARKLVQHEVEVPAIDQRARAHRAAPGQW